MRADEGRWWTLKVQDNLKQNMDEIVNSGRWNSYDAFLGLTMPPCYAHWYKRLFRISSVEDFRFFIDLIREIFN